MTVWYKISVPEHNPLQNPSFVVSCFHDNPAHTVYLIPEKKRSFNVNVAEMRSASQKSTEEMWLLVGGYDNWARVRKLEEDFYQKHTTGLELDDENDSTNRVPANTGPKF